MANVKKGYKQELNQTKIKGEQQNSAPSAVGIQVKTVPRR